MDAESYLLNVKVKLAISRAIQSVEIIDERIVLSDRGYFRARLSLSNDDFLEIAEYFICENGECFPKTYERSFSREVFIMIRLKRSLLNFAPRYNSRRRLTECIAKPFRCLKPGRGTRCQDLELSIVPAAIISIIDNSRKGLCGARKVVFSAHRLLLLSVLSFENTSM